jgi:hypothetical protein
MGIHPKKRPNDRRQAVQLLGSGGVVSVKVTENGYVFRSLHGYERVHPSGGSSRLYVVPHRFRQITLQVVCDPGFQNHPRHILGIYIVGGANERFANLIDVEGLAGESAVTLRDAAQAVGCWKASSKAACLSVQLRVP